MQAAGKVVVAPLPEVLEVILGEIILDGDQLIAGSGFATFRVGQGCTKRTALEDVPAWQLGTWLEPAGEFQGCGIFEQIIHD